MPRYVAQNQSIGCSLPVLEIFTIIDGFQKDAEVVEFQIFDEEGNQTFPISGRQAIDTTQACPTGGKLGKGHYVATWAVPDDEATGAHEIHWFWKETAASAEISFIQAFEVLFEGSIVVRVWNV